jgi:hypothetical protein
MRVFSYRPHPREFRKVEMLKQGVAATVLLVFSWSASAICLAGDAIPVGPGKFAADIGGSSIDVFTFKPEGYQDGPLIVVCHGMQRNAEEYCGKACGLAERVKAVVAAPLFDLQRYPIEAYQLGGVYKKGELQPAERWTVSVIPKIVKAVRQREGKPALPYYLIGHSAGGQFLARLSALTTSDSRQIVLANPGTHLFPTRDARFPHGFGGLPDALSDDAALRRYLAQPITIYLGTADLGDADLSKVEAAMKQGATRYERGKNCFKAAQELAKDKGWPFHWRLVEAPGVIHDAQAMFDHPSALKALLGDVGGD